MLFNKRRFIAAVGAGLAGPATAFAQTLAPTPRQTEGPFYPYARPLEQDFDLTRLRGHSDRARGPVLDLVGRVMTRDGKPAANVLVELWQANAAGRYDHPGEAGSRLPLDPNFQGYGTQRTDGEGRFRFLTIKPAAYPSGGSIRPAHIHFKFKNAENDLTTQMYFPGDAHLARDFVFRGQSPQSSPLLARLQENAGGEPGSALCRWDVVLANA